MFPPSLSLSPTFLHLSPFSSFLFSPSGISASPGKLKPQVDQMKFDKYLLRQENASS